MPTIIFAKKNYVFIIKTMFHISLLNFDDEMSLKTSFASSLLKINMLGKAFFANQFF